MTAVDVGDAVAAVNRNVMGQVHATVVRVWSTLPDLSDESADRAIAQVVPTVSTGQTMVAATQATYLSQITGLPLPAPLVATLVPGASWNRVPIVQARRLVSEGETVTDALMLAARRAAQVHSGDVLRARSDAGTALSYGVEPYRGVRWAKTPNPQACEWCRLVATKLYYRPDGLPAHLNCKCTATAVTPSMDLGSYTNADSVFANYRWRSRVKTEDLRDIQARIGEEALRKYQEATANMFAQAA